MPKIISLLDEICNGLPNDADELMGFNKATIIDKMLAVALPPEVLVGLKFWMELVPCWMEHKEKSSTEGGKRAYNKFYESGGMEGNILKTHYSKNE